MPDIPLGKTKPDIVTPSASTILFLQQPGAANVNQPISPAVAVQVRNPTGQVMVGVNAPPRSAPTRVVRR